MCIVVMIHGKVLFVFLFCGTCALTIWDGKMRWDIHGYIVSCRILHGYIVKESWNHGGDGWERLMPSKVFTLS